MCIRDRPYTPCIDPVLKLLNSIYAYKIDSVADGLVILIDSDFFLFQIHSFGVISYLFMNLKFGLSQRRRRR